MRYLRDRTRSAVAPAAPATPFPFRTTTRVRARGSAGAERVAFFALGAPRTSSFAAARTWRASGLPSKAIPATTSTTSSAAATRLTTTVAVRQGRTSASREGEGADVCKRTPVSLPRSTLLLGGESRLSAKRTSGGGLGEPGGSPSSQARRLIA